MKKILITGGAGFIGSNFVHYMIKKYADEYELVVVDKLTYSGDQNRLAAVEEKIDFHQADICDENAMDELVKGSHFVVHFAAETHVDRSIADPGPFLHSNILGTEVLARLSLKHDVVRFHHVSTDEVFGTLELNTDDMFSEETPYNPRSPYSASKASSDHLVRAYGDTYGLPYSITNCSNNYGPWDSPARIIPVFITNALMDQPLPIYGKGQFVRDYLYVYDHCTAIDLALHQGKADTTYCVGGAAQRNGVQVAEAILDALNKPKSLIEYVTDRPGHDPRYAIDPSRLRSDLGWEQSVTFEEGIRQTVEWYRTHEEWWRPLKERISLMRESKAYEKAKGKRVANG